MNRINLSVSVSVLLAASSAAMAQYTAVEPPQNSAAPSGPASAPGFERNLNLTITPKAGQTPEQTWSDRYECHGWAKAQSNFDPTLAAQTGMTPQQVSAGRENYRRALTACLEGKGYAVQYGRPVSPAVTPAPVPQTRLGPATRVVSTTPELKYHPFQAQIDGGYTATVGNSDHLLDDGWNVGFGFTWFPTSALPVGLRVDGSYSSFEGRRAFRDLYGPDTLRADENVYGGDVDLQFDLARASPYSKFYLLGGAGWYREQTWLRQFAFENGTFCGFYGCQQGTFPVRFDDRITSSWKSSWNAGLGWEVATPGGPSFFVEARYLQIAPSSNKMQFVPIRIGMRF